MNISNWKSFYLGRIFRIEYGVNLELNACEESSEKDAINFVSRSKNNNGVTAKISPIEGTLPQKAGLISVASGGSSVLSTFVQVEPFYSGRDLYILECKENISIYAKLFVTTLIEANKFRYSFGRQANKTLQKLEIQLPIKYCDNGKPYIDESCKYSDDGYIPDWEFMEKYIKSLHYKPITTTIKASENKLEISDWEEFEISKLFNVQAGQYYYSDEYEAGLTPYVSASDTNNGISEYINLKPDFDGNKITIGKIGARAYYQAFPFCATSDVNVLTPLFNMSEHVGLFITSIINFSESYKWSYGRQCRIGDTKSIKIRLPIKKDINGKPIIDKKFKYSQYGYIPDWDYMELFIKKRPYGDRLSSVKMD